MGLTPEICCITAYRLPKEKNEQRNNKIIYKGYTAKVVMIKKKRRF